MKASLISFKTLQWFVLHVGSSICCMLVKAYLLLMLVPACGYLSVVQSNHFNHQRLITHHSLLILVVDDIYTMLILRLCILFKLIKDPAVSIVWNPRFFQLLIFEQYSWNSLKENNETKF